MMFLLINIFTSSLILVQSGLVDSVFNLFKKMRSPIDVDLIASLAEFIAESLTVGLDNHKRISLLIHKDHEFLNTIVGYMKLVSSQDCILPATSIFKMVSSCAEMIAIILACPKLHLKKNICDQEDPVMCLASKVRINNVDCSKDNLMERKEMRKSIMKALLALSTLSQMMQYFLNNWGYVVRMLLAIASSFKSEYESTREMALIILTNLSTNLSNDDGDNDNDNKFGQYIVANGGANLLTNLCLGDRESAQIIKQRSTALLSRLVLSSLIKLDDQTTQNLWKEFTKITSKKTWNNGKIVSVSAESIAATASNLLKIYIATTEKVKCYEDIDVMVIINLLPNPKTNPRGEVDSLSVCQPPEKPHQDTVCAFASIIPSFYANLLKLLILYLDSNPQKHHRHLLEAKGIEYLVSLLANSNKHHSTVTKNASLVLARLVKNNDAAMARCRELRGMEILVELGKTGRI